MKSNINIYDVAKLAGVSISTVSRVLNNRGRVKDETEQKVLAAIKELGFYPNMVARGLAMNTTGIVGVLLPSFNDYNYPDSYTIDYLNGVQQALSKRSYNLLVINDNNMNANSNPEYMKLIKGKKMDGFITTNTKVSNKAMKEIKELDFPLVLLADSSAASEIAYVALDYKQYYAQAIHSLAVKGHKNIAVINYENSTKMIKTKNEVISEVFSGCGLNTLDGQNIINGAEYKDTLYEKLKDLLESKNYTAFFVDSVYFGRRLADAAGDLGLKIPEDISVVCFEYVQNEAKRLHVPLSCIHISSYRAGEACVELLFNRITNHSDVRWNVNIDGIFIDNGSIRQIY